MDEISMQWEIPFKGSYSTISLNVSIIPALSTGCTTALNCNGSYVWNISWLLPKDSTYEDIWVSSPYSAGAYLIGSNGYYVKYPGNKLPDLPNVPRGQRPALF